MFRFVSATYLSAVGLFMLALPVDAKAGEVALSFTETVQGSNLLYNFSVTDNVPLDETLLSATLSVPAQANAVQNLMAPAGFSAFFDPGLGLVDFIENTSGFVPGVTVSGFTFTSPFLLTNPGFTALALDSLGNPVTFSGTAVGPGSPTPEPGSFGLSAIPFLLLAGSAAAGKLRSKWFNGLRAK